MGITIRQIVEDIGDGIADGNTFKAVQIGGPSGGCIPAVKLILLLIMRNLLSLVQ